MQNSIEGLQHSAKEFTRVMKDLQDKNIQISASDRNRLDDILMKAERSFTRTAGLPGRPWFVHFIYAPGLYTGYGVKTLPGVREAIEQRDWKEAGEQIMIVATVIEGYAGEISRATSIVTRAMTGKAAH